MSWKTGPIQDGDWVIAYAGKDRISALQIKRGQVYQTKWGSFQHNDFIGKLYGSKVLSKSGGWICLLSPTPELFTAGALQHRTQIIYTVDISMITFHLELRPGLVVVESGTGSGSLSRAIARSIAPTGHLHTFEFHEQRAKLARESFSESQLSEVITVRCGDACESGFAPLAEGSVDAVMLDLPSPWLAIPHAAHVLRHYGMICNFSPCIEQVQRACDALRENGFSSLTTIECLLRPYEVRPLTFEPLPTSPPAPKGKRKAQEVSEKTEKAEPERERELELEEEEKTENTEKEAPKKGKTASKPEEPSSKSATLHYVKPEVEIRGHTSYLTFARRIRP